MATKIPPEFFTHELNHKYGGNGLFFVKMIDEEYCHCAWIPKGQAPTEVRTLRVELLSKFEMPTKDEKTGDLSMKDFPIEPKAQEQLKRLREDLESGKRVIKNNWYIRAA